MTDREAWRWVGVGGALLLVGALLLAASGGTPFLLPMWGVGFATIGLMALVVGAGVLLRLWR
jgi:hypothetical protein